MKLILLSALLQFLFFSSFSFAKIPPHVRGTVCHAEALWCWAPVVGPPGAECGCPTPGGFISGTLEGLSESVNEAIHPESLKKCKPMLLSFYGYRSIGKGTYGRVEKDNSITIIKQDGSSTSVQSKGGCNSSKQKVSSLLKERIKNLETAYKASMLVPAEQILSQEQEAHKSTLDICKAEESESDWYKEAQSGEVAPVKKPKRQISYQ